MTQEQRTPEKEFDVVVIGAGIAGLAAARKLAEAKWRVGLIEARQRAGGRIATVPAAGGELPVELGAEFLHGLPPELFQLVEEAGLHTFELSGEFRCVKRGRVGPCDSQDEAFHLLDRLKGLWRDGGKDGEIDQGNPDRPSWCSEQDIPFSEYVAQQGASPEVAASATGYVEGFNAADASRISILALGKQQAAEDAISGDRAFRISEGYARLPEYLLRQFTGSGGECFFSLPVRSIRWDDGSVEVRAVAGEGTDRLPESILRARAAIITLPLGVLQARSVEFLPSPAPIFQAADKLAMGTAGRVVFEFDTPLWAQTSSLEGVRFLLAPEETPPTWWTTMPRESSTVTGWIAGKKARQLPLDSLPERGLETLARILDRTPRDLRSHLVQAHFHDWQADPFSLGAYSYVPAGAMESSSALSAPIGNTLYFAGEHTDTTGHWGTVHGALRSGYRAAQQLLLSSSPLHVPRAVTLP